MEPTNSQQVILEEKIYSDIWCLILLDQWKLHTILIFHAESYYNLISIKNTKYLKIQYQYILSKC